MSHTLRATIQAMESAIIACRRDLHRHPEAGWTEYRTTALAIKRMRELGYSITCGEKAVNKDFIMGAPSQEILKAHEQRALSQGADPEILAQMQGITGFWADIKCSDDPITVAVRFDMDANDVQESHASSHRPAAENFASLHDGVMHACGHDGHVAIGLAVAEIMAGMKDTLKGTLRFIFQPGEEGCRGAEPMVEAGAMEGVDYALGLHVSFQAAQNGQLICGTVGFLATTKWDVTFTGQQAHAGAAPQEGKNALLAAAVCALNLHAISRHSDGVTRINVGKLVAGQGRNVLPPNGLLLMETRGSTSELNNYMLERSEKIIQAAAHMYDCEHSITAVGSAQSAQSDAELIAMVAEEAKSIPFYTDIIERKDFGACEDFTHMMRAVQNKGGKSTYIQVGIDRAAGHHYDTFDFDESGLAPAVELVCKCVHKLLQKA